MDEKNTSAKVAPKGSKGSKEAFITTEEKAQYEVFKNGSLPRETIEKWIRNDFSAIISMAHGILSDPDIFDVIVDKYYEKYKALHVNGTNDVAANNK